MAEYYIQRMITEHKLLMEYLNKLKDALCEDGVEEKVGMRQYRLMKKQYNAMMDYEFCLSCRLYDKHINVKNYKEF